MKEDVLGKILGWRSHPLPRRKQEQLPTIFRNNDVTVSHTTGTLKKSHSTEELTTAPPPGLHRLSLPNNTHHHHHPVMHGVASNESIRTAKPDTISQLLEPLKSPPRFQDPAVFDLFTTYSLPPPPQDSAHRFLSPDLSSNSPSETSSLPRSLGVSFNSSHHQPHELPSNTDPRFVIWADHPHHKDRSSVALDPRRHPASASTSNLGIDHSTGHLTHSPTHPKRWSRTGKTAVLPDPHSNSSPNLAASSTTTHGRSREDFSQVHSSLPSSSEDHLPKSPCHHRILMAATIERWIAELTTQIDSLGLTEFFFTYRTIMKPSQLAQLLASRFEWSIMFSSSAYAQSLPARKPNSSVLDTNSERCILSLDGRCLVLDHDGETLRRVAKVRTFVMIRHWLVHHFEDDFLHDPSLQTELHDWFENLTEKIKRVQRIINALDAEPQNPQQDYQASFGGEDDLRILKTLRRTLRKQQLTHQSFNLVVSGQVDSTQGSITTLEDGPPSLSKNKPPKVDARELFKQSEGGAVSDPESPLRRHRRAHTTDLIHRFPSKGSLGHGRHHSVNTLAQLRAANFSKSDLRLCGFESYESETRNDLENEKRNASEANQTLILKLKSIFESDTRRPRHNRAQSVMKENSSTDPCRYSFTQDSSRLLKHDRSSFNIPRYRPSESISVPPNQTPQHRLNLSNPPPTQYHQQGSLSLPQHHNPLQRYFTSTMGTIGRFKRMINNRSGPHISSIPVANHHHSLSGVIPGPTSSSLYLSNDITDFQQDPFSNEVADLLCVRGGLERYLSFFDIQRDSSISAYEEEGREEVATENNSSTLRNSERGKVRKPSFAHESSEELNQSSGSPVVQYDDRFQSQLSLSSSLSNTTCTTRSIPSDTDGELETKVSDNNMVVFSTNFFGEPNQINESVPTPQEHLLHGSMSVETIKSESHPLTIPSAGMGLLKKQLRKKFTNKDMCPVLMRASMDESFSGSVPNPTSPVIRYSEDNLRMSHLSMSVPTPGDYPDGEVRPTSVQLDDVDAFDSDDEFPVAGQKLRRFPGTADLKQAIAIGRKSLFNIKGSFLKANDDRIKRFSSETSSSIGTRRVPSIAASMFRRSKLSHRSSTPIPRSASVVSSIQPSRVPEMEEEEVNGAPAVVANFVADGLESDDDEPGDVEAALRRLEGVIDADREKEKAKKVELQMMKSMEASKRRTGTFSQAGSRYSHNSLIDELGDQLQTCSESAEDDCSENSDEEADEEEEGAEEEYGHQSCEENGHDGDAENAPDDGYELESTLSSLVVSHTHRSGMASSDSIGSPRRLSLSRPGITIPQLQTPSKSFNTPGSKSHLKFFTTTNSKKLSFDQSNDRKMFRPSNGKLDTVSQKLFSVNNDTPNQLMPRNPITLTLLPPLPPVHRSFLLDCRTEILAQQFCLIERDLLRNITWQELLLSKWQENRSSRYHHGKPKAGSRMEDVVVTCWESFMKQRAKEKMKLKGRIHLHHASSFDSSEKSPLRLDGTEIHALIMRFNLTCNWVASELVLTFNLEERVALLGKFIRLAFKCYRQNNFQTLTQIIHGLQTPYVERLKKTWSKLGIWESRMFRDLKEFTSHLSNFKSLRNVQDSLINESQTSLTNDPMSSGYNPRSSHSHSRGSSSSVTACIPFLGLYLRDLTINDELPTYLDPTDPSVPVSIDETSGKLKKLSNPKIIENLPKLTTSNAKGAEEYYPLVNINKMRNYAKIVLKIIEFQNRSTRFFAFDTHDKWFITCLKINCLRDHQLKSLSLTCEP